MVAERAVRQDLDPGTPQGINVAVGAVVITIGSLLAGLVPSSDQAGRCAVVALVVAGFAAVTADLRSTAWIVVPTWMIMNGFLVNHTGDLSWHGRADVDRLLALAAAGLLGWGIGTTAQALRHARENWWLTLEVAQLATEHNEAPGAYDPLHSAEKVHHL